MRFINILITVLGQQSLLLFKSLNNKLIFNDFRYNAITWFPKSLMIQFLRAANIYFLIVTILTAMPFSPKVLIFLKFMRIS